MPLTPILPLTVQNTVPRRLIKPRSPPRRSASAIGAAFEAAKMQITKTSDIFKAIVSSLQECYRKLNKTFSCFIIKCRVITWFGENAVQITSIYSKAITKLMQYFLTKGTYNLEDLQLKLKEPTRKNLVITFIHIKI